LRDKREQGNYRKATEEYIALLNEVVEKAPSEFGYEFGSWTAQRLSTYLQEQTGIKLSSNAGSGLPLTIGLVRYLTKAAPYEDAALVKLKQLLHPFGLTHFYTDGWGAYLRLLDQQHHTVGKVNTQKIERKHLTLRTRIKRLARKTSCFSKSTLLHDIMIGLFINRYEFGRAV
jgi:insertion element IS1 protein InsB